MAGTPASRAAGSVVERLLGDLRRQAGRPRAGVVDAVGTRAPGGASWPAAVSPGAIRRAVTRKPVWPIILWPGTDREALDVPVADQRLPGLRLGEAAVRAERLDGPAELGGGRDVGADQAAGRQRLGDRVDALPRREHVEDDPVDAAVLVVERLDEVADGELPGRVPAAEELVDVLRRATSANSWRRSYDDTRPAGPTARSSEQVSAPEPTPASTTRAPGKMSAIATIWAASLG